jgi:hypothetical protein
VKSQAAKSTEPIAQAAIPIVARQELAIFMTIGIVGLVAGLALQALSYHKVQESCALSRRRSARSGCSGAAKWREESTCQ